MRSLRSRLVVGSLLALALALTIANVLVYDAMRRQLVARLDRSLREAILPVVRDGDAPDGGGRRSDGRAGGPAPSAVAVETRRIDGSIERSTPAPLTDGSSAAPRLPLVVDIPASDPDMAVFFEVPSVEPGGPRFRVKAERQRDGSQLLIAAPLTDVEDTLRRLRLVEAGVSAAALVAGGTLALAMVTVALRPLRRVEAAAADVAAGDLDRRAGLPGNRSEVGKLGAAVDTMVDRLTDALGESAASEARLRRFVADGAHELRTPVAAVAAYAELIERGASSRPEDLERAVRGIRAETTRLGELVEDLLVLARLDEARPTEQRPVELVSLAADAVAASLAIGPAWPVRLVATRPVDTVGDATALRRAIDNLLTNVRTHTPPGTSAVVAVTVLGDRARIAVADDGPGLDRDDHARVFERFWRSDASRTRASGGAGLGLAIVAAIAEAHGGSATIEPTAASGTTVVVDLILDPGDAERPGR